MLTRPFPEAASTFGPAADPPHEGRVLLYSLALPGAGQHALGQRRWVAYLAAEALGWVFLVDRRRKGTSLRDAYRDLAWEVARGGGAGPRVDADFSYYERLSKWERSGTFDREPARAGLQPETDPDTYNGSVWSLARRIFFADPGNPPSEGDPAHARALDYYRERAYPDELSWDWSGDRRARDRFGELISGSDEALRDATIAGGLVLANHLLSATDAFVSARLRDVGQTSGALRVGSSPTPGGGWSLRLEIRR